HRVPEAVPPARRALRDDCGQRDEHEDAEPADRDAEAETRRGADRQRRVRRGRDRPQRGVRRHRARRGLQDRHPAEVSTLMTMPLSGSKNLSFTADHPPRSAIVVSLATAGYGLAGSFAPLTSVAVTPETAGRKPLLAKIC